jgi:hypothetical protein
MPPDGTQQLICSPQRKSGPSRKLIVALALLLTAFPLLPWLGMFTVGISTLLLTTPAWWERLRSAVHLGLFCTLYCAAMVAGVPFSQVSFGLGARAGAGHRACRTLAPRPNRHRPSNIAESPQRRRRVV